MLPIINQTVAVTKINLLSLPRRLPASLATILAIALVVTVLLGFLAMANGFRQTISGGGSDKVVLIMREGSTAELNSVLSGEQQHLLEAAPGIVREKGKPLVSKELYVIVDGTKKASGTQANISLRGIGAEGLATRPNARIVKGRMSTPGSNEIVVGRGVLREFSGFEVGRTVRLGANVWKVVGAFEAGGSVFESELWGDAHVVQSLFNRGNTIQVFRARLDGPDAMERIKAYIKADARLNVEAKTEAEYFAEQARQLTDLIQYMGWPLGILMALGALAGALNTMYASVAARAGEIATLRTIGFGSFPTFLGTLFEALILAVAGALAGVLIVYIAFDGMTAATMGGSFTQVVFSFKLTPVLALQGLILALSVGMLGGFFPALRAARQKIAEIERD